MGYRKILFAADCCYCVQHRQIPIVASSDGSGSSGTNTKTSTVVVVVVFAE